MKSISFILCLFGWILPLQHVSAQPITQEHIRQIDSLFTPFNQGPPVSYGIIYRGQVLHKEFGKGPHAETVSGPTRYNVGSMASHITAYAILLLAEQKRIRLEDEISQYLGPGERGQFEGITIGNVLSHSHGLPDYWALKSLGGYSGQDRFTATEAEALFEKPLKKIYPTGEQVSFSGTGPYLLARILEKVTEQNLHTFAEEQIFSPFGMKNTYFAQPGLRSNPIAYERMGDSYEPQTIGHYDHRPAGLLTTMEDLMIWFEHLSDTSLPINQKMDDPIRFRGEQIAQNPNGQITYGQQFMHDERGINTFWDYGQIGGFASCVFRFPSHDLTIVTLSKNGIPYNGYLGMQISEVLLEGAYQEEDPIEMNASTLPMTEEIKEKFTGSYFDTAYLLYRKIIARNDTLFYVRPDHGDEQALFPISKNELEMRTEFGTYTFSKLDGHLQLAYENTYYSYESLPPTSPNSLTPPELAGTYVCKDWSLVLTLNQDEKGNLRLEADAQELELHRVDAYRFVSSHPLYSLLTLQVDAAGELEGVLVSNIGFKDLPFKKISF